MKRAMFATTMLILAACSKGGGGSSDLAFGKPGEPPGVLSKVVFGEPDSETIKKVPGLNYSGYEGRWSPNGDTDVTITSADISRKTSKIRIRFEKKKIDELVKAWGPGKEGKDILGGKALFYVNADSTIRAEAGENEGGGFKVEFRPMTPLAKLVSDDATSVGGIKLLGGNPEEVYKAASQAGFDPEKGKLKAPTTEWSATHTLVTYETGEDGAIKSYTVFLDTKLAPTAKEEILATLEKKFGKPTATKNSIGSDELVFKAENPKIAVRPTDDTMFLEVSK